MRQWNKPSALHSRRRPFRGWHVLLVVFICAAAIWSLLSSSGSKKATINEADVGAHPVQHEDSVVVKEALQKLGEKLRGDVPKEEKTEAPIDASFLEDEEVVRLRRRHGFKQHGEFGLGRDHKHHAKHSKDELNGPDVNFARMRQEIKREDHHAGNEEDLSDADRAKRLLHGIGTKGGGRSRLLRQHLEELARKGRAEGNPVDVEKLVAEGKAALENDEAALNAELQAEAVRQRERRLDVEHDRRERRHELENEERMHKTANAIAEQIETLHKHIDGGNEADDHRRRHELELQKDEVEANRFDTDADAANRAAASLGLSLFTTLKECDDATTLATQLTAVQSWTNLPLHPKPTVYIVGESTCNDKLIKALYPGGETDMGADQLKRAVVLLPDVAEGKHGTVLLGAAVEAVRKRDPDADVYGFFNADILVSPTAVVALAKVAAMFKQFFIVGYRATVDIKQDKWETIDFAGNKWEHHPSFRRVGYDRVDAEDYFLWSSRFFSARNVQIPNFHIGRPAFDNWLVNAALHTFQPVVDATRVLRAYHRKHGYAHLDKDKTAKADDKKTYWGGEEQEENYSLGKAAGGWQHGLIEFVPWGFACEGDLEAEEKKDEQGRFPRPDLLTTDQMNTRCALQFKKDWKPLSQGEYGDLEFYFSKYRAAVNQGKLREFDNLKEARLGTA